MRRQIERSLERVFAILPKDRVGPAVSATLARLNETGGGHGPLLKWAEFDLRGGFRRGGAAALYAHVATVAPTACADPDIARLARNAADGAAQPGRVVRDPDGERFALYLPASSTATDGPPELRVRGYLIDSAVFAAILTFFNPGAGVTDAERRVVFQVVSGTSLREAAAVDRVSVETKRAQLKHAAAKLQCSGQLDLLRLVMGQLIYVASIAEDEAGEARFAADFVARHFGGLELTLERLPDGRLLRCVEAGPAAGRPVVALHGMMFGMLLSGAAPSLAAAGIRLIMPLRRGYLDPRPVLGLASNGDLAVERLADVAALIDRRGLAPATVVGHSLGAVLALQLADRRPEIVSRVALLSMNALRHGKGDPAGRLYGGYRSLARLSRAITFEFSRHYPDEASARAILHGMFASSVADIDTLEGRCAASSVYQWFPALYAGSVAGIADDYVLAMSKPAPPRCPALFIHGADDPLTTPPTVRVLAADAPRASVRLIQGAGHFAVASHAAEVWSTIAKFAAADLS